MRMAGPRRILSGMFLIRTRRGEPEIKGLKREVLRDEEPFVYQVGGGSGEAYLEKERAQEESIPGNRVPSRRATLCFSQYERLGASQKTS